MKDQGDGLCKNEVYQYIKLECEESLDEFIVGGSLRKSLSRSAKQSSVFLSPPLPLP